MNKYEKSFLSELFPAHSDLNLILRQIREKYSIPNFDDPVKNLSGLLQYENTIPWDQIKSDIQNEIRKNPELFSDRAQFLRSLANNPEALEGPATLAEMGDITEEVIQQVAKAIMLLVKPMVEAYNQIVEDVSELLLYYLTTGDTEEIPSGWQGAVFVLPFLGEPMVVAMASQLSNPKEIRDRFFAEIHRQFGKDRPKVTKGMLNFSPYLRQHMSGDGLAKIADAYIADHPNEFTKDRSNPVFRDQRNRLMDRLKKALGRYEEKLSKLIGDKN